MPNILQGTFPGYNYFGATPKLYLFADKDFVSANGTPFIKGRFGLDNWQYIFNCTADAGVLTVPAKVVEPTTNSDNPLVKWSAVLLDNDDIRRRFIVKKFRLPHDVESITWKQIRAFNLLATNQQMINQTIHRLNSVVWDLSQANKVLLTAPTEKTAVVLFFIVRNGGDLVTVMGGKTLSITNQENASLIYSDDWANFNITTAQGFQQLDIDNSTPNRILTSGNTISANNSAVGAGNVTIETFGYYL